MQKEQIKDHKSPPMIGNRHRRQHERIVLQLARLYIKESMNESKKTGRVPFGSRVNKYLNRDIYYPKINIPIQSSGSMPRAYRLGL